MQQRFEQQFLREYPLCAPYGDGKICELKTAPKPSPQLMALVRSASGDPFAFDMIFQDFWLLILNMIVCRSVMEASGLFPFVFNDRRSSQVALLCVYHSFCRCESIFGKSISVNSPSNTNFLFQSARNALRVMHLGCPLRYSS